MIDIPTDAIVRSLLIKSRYVPAYYCLIDDIKPDDGLPLYHDIYHFLRLGVYPEAATAKDKRVLRPRLCRSSDERVWGIDIIGKILPKSSNGHEFILVAINYFTKWIEEYILERRLTPYRDMTSGIIEADWAQARLDQLNLLDERRLRATNHVRAYQRKMTCAFKKRVKPRPLWIGDLVLKVIRGLIKDPKGKFRPNWSRPYFIRELTTKGIAWLMDLDGN
ncbi:hypothetical protein CK203_048573 [Vitis vinifera]|uniref:Integrase catalytic domain-containing protein n=1 Tax=Vitis vinifera TaxID=29760 RepID=A0A438HK12_VITVI|nr:hypothetical protein CK203_048573 [Vitis vinifera]